MKSRANSGGMVYSTELGRTCPTCRRALNLCVCPTNTTRILGDGNVRVSRESKGRGGKTVTLVTGLPLNSLDLADIATKLKRRCGSGGTIKDGIIEIQGDHRDQVFALLTELGHRPKRSGG